jgi:hypothetical protein
MELEVIESFAEDYIRAAKGGALDQARADAFISADAFFHSDRSKQLPPAVTREKVTTLLRYMYTGSVSWAVFSSEWMDSLAALIRHLTSCDGAPRVLEVCAGKGTLTAPMRARGIGWHATERKHVSAPPDGLVQSDALAAVLEGPPPDLVFWSWWSKIEGARANGAEPEDCSFVRYCWSHGIPMVFVGEGRGGLTGSAALWDGPWTIAPASSAPVDDACAKRCLCGMPQPCGCGLMDEDEDEGGEPGASAARAHSQMPQQDCTWRLGSPFCDVPRWPGFHDRTWCIVPGEVRGESK